MDQCEAINGHIRCERPKGHSVKTGDPQQLVEPTLHAHGTLIWEPCPAPSGVHVYAWHGGGVLCVGCGLRARPLSPEANSALPSPPAKADL
jgi:hypothetical protein